MLARPQTLLLKVPTRHSGLIGFPTHAPGLQGPNSVAPRKPPQAPGSSQAATQPAASETGPSTPLPANRSKRTEAEQAAESTQPTKGTGKGKAAKAKPTPQPGR
ncbi:hypothetical protein QJQ45_025655 [Haematococcus lacustris]|nr:hypothetical protein QJQ45_025655 [Haematococcus lacustris]